MPRRHLTRIGVRESVPPLPATADEGSRGYPRPMLRRDAWWSLDGDWDFMLDSNGDYREPSEVKFDRVIRVPFAPESERSGIGDKGLYRSCWYRREVSVPPHAASDRVLLHFGAVDYHATVWINGTLAARHEGGYTPFSVDITALVREPTYVIVVRAFDDPLDLCKPRGKQDWQLHPHSIWYPRTTGIWQTVWQEVVPQLHIQTLRWTPYLDRWEVALTAHISGADGFMPDELTLALKLYGQDVLLVDDRYSVAGGEVHRRLSLSDPGIDDFRNELLWSPESPTLLDAELSLLNADGAVVDRVWSYAALRSFAADGNRLVLNGRPYFLRLVLDQGYWPDTGSTPPDDDAIRRDIELTKAMGFNGVRKHQKIEDPRYLYWADRIGLLVWEEMPSAYRFTEVSVARLTRQWIEIVERDVSHPCIVAWVPFNESWGVPNLPDIASQRHYVQALYYLTKTLDPTRPVVGNDGWENITTDIVGIHDYDESPKRISARYAVPMGELSSLLKHERPGGRNLAVGAGLVGEVPVVLSEIGGIALSTDPATWGYSAARSAEELEQRYTALLEAVRDLPMLSGFCYTQLCDTYQEANGLLYADRTPKVPVERIARATRTAARTLSEAGLLNERSRAPDWL
jgi:beta-galactosidase/beta-glucuronidase